MQKPDSLFLPSRPGIGGATRAATASLYCYDISCVFAVAYFRIVSFIKEISRGDSRTGDALFPQTLSRMATKRAPPNELSRVREIYSSLSRGTNVIAKIMRNIVLLYGLAAYRD